MNAIDKFGAYRKAVELFDRVVEDLAPLRKDFSLGRLISQQIASADSICANIEEGYGRLSRQEYIRFLDFSRGSARETRGRYFRMHHWSNAQTIHERIRSLDEIIGILTGTIETLKRTPDTRHSSFPNLKPMKNTPIPAFASLLPTLRCFGATRRRPRQNLLVAALVGAVAFTSTITQAADPLASWNDGPAKQAILEFVKATTTQGSPEFVPPEERVATFDQDGTLWVEHPMYTQVMYCLERVPDSVKAKPELANVAPFNTVLELLHGDRAAMEKLTLPDLEKIGMATITDIPVETFQAEVKQWLAEAKHPRWKKPYTELTYLPMQDVMKYLRANRYKTYIVTGGGQDFVRVYAEQTYGIPPEQIVGTALGTKYGYEKDGKPFLTKEPKLVLNDNDGGKPEGIHLMIGRRPHIAFGNSTGDQQMLEYTKAGDGARLSLLVLHDDADREYAYGPAEGLPDTKVGTFTQALYDEAKKNGWTVISMKKDWKAIFAFENK